MTDIRKRRLSTAIAMAPLAALGFPALVRAQDKTLSVVLTVPAGTSLDNIGRTLAEKMRVSLGRPVIVEARPGGGGAVGVQHIKNGPDDGSVLLLAPTSQISMHAMFASTPSFEPEKDLSPVCEVAASPHTITVNTAMGVNTFAAYVEHMRKHPELQSIGTPSLAGLATLMIYQMSKSLNLNFQHVPYRGGQPLLVDLLGNQVPAAGSVMADYLPEQRNGRLRILAHASNERSPLAPDIPTFKELGYPFYEARTTFGYFAKKGTPPDLLAEYGRHLTDALRMPDVVAKLNGLGLSQIGGTPAEYAQVVRSHATQWGPLIKESGIKIN
ncbi:tripartite tricarboxylate transporter substrate-binding protein [Comamonadaceae bacterium G21597-S1]|nr:tripartite tricarboxylate transporter substrate-binding protein [Comamonadaceae bacterium G21597-S1]